MSYEQSAIKCDWCGQRMDDGADVACKSCHQELEEQVADLEKKVDALTDQLRDAENLIVELRS